MKENSKTMNEMTRILALEASAEEREHFFISLEKDDAKREAFQALEQQWVIANNAMLHKSIDLDSAWEKQKSQHMDLTPERKNSVPMNALKWAAIIVLGIGLAYYVINPSENKDIQYTTVFTGPNEILAVTLSDGSIVTLNQLSKLIYANDFKERNVQFQGEAYFDIAADPNRPFLINMDHGFVRVLGTEFNIKNTNNGVKVSVIEGLVEFGNANRNDVTKLNTGTSATLANQQLSTIKGLSVNDISWYTKDLVFDQTPLPDVFTELSSTYLVDFEYDPKTFMDCRLTGRFNNEDLTDILTTLKTIFKVDFISEVDKFQVTGQSCESN